MAEDEAVPLDALETAGWKEPARWLLESVVDVGRRLDHDVLGLEHLLVAAAEAGDPALSGLTGNPAALREALLDLLHQDRARFRRRKGAKAVVVQPELAALLGRLGAGEALGPLL